MKPREFYKIMTDFVEEDKRWKALQVGRITSYNVCYTKLLRYEITDKNRKLIQKSVDNYKLLMRLTDKSSVGFQRYMPESMIIEKNIFV